MPSNTRSFVNASAFAAFLAVAGVSPAVADEGHDHDGSHGKPGTASRVTRTINVTLGDNFFEPTSIAVKAGETVRFVLSNRGTQVHEFSIGTTAMNAMHRKEMIMMQDMGILDGDRIAHEKMHMKMSDGRTMKHDDPNSVLLEPGQSAQLIWTFPAATRLEFACNVPGHYEAGMAGQFRFRN
jgi:uncharacterized cupredoxin-like copper-binding protein